MGSVIDELLLVLGSQISSPDTKNSAEASSLFDEVGNCLLKELFQQSPYANPASGDTKRIQSIVGDAAPEELVSYIKVLSDVLRTDEEIVWSHWNSSNSCIAGGGGGANGFGASEAAQTKISSTPEYPLRPIETFHALRTAYLQTTRRSAWMLLQELLRIDMDSEHPFHEGAARAIDQLLKRNLSSLLLDHLTVLQSWQPNPVRTQNFKGCSALEISKFSAFNNVAWAEEYAQEVSSSVETLILLCYSRHTLSVGDFSSVVSMFFAHSTAYFRRSSGGGGGGGARDGAAVAGSEAAMSEPPLLASFSEVRMRLLIDDDEKVHVKQLEQLQFCISGVFFRLLVFAAEAMQFWRLYQVEANAFGGDLATGFQEKSGWRGIGHPFFLPAAGEIKSSSTATEDTIAALQEITEALASHLLLLERAQDYEYGVAAQAGKSLAFLWCKFVMAFCTTGNSSLAPSLMMRGEGEGEEDDLASREYTRKMKEIEDWVNFDPILNRLFQIMDIADQRPKEQMHGRRGESGEESEREDVKSNANIAVDSLVELVSAHMCLSQAYSTTPSTSAYSSCDPILLAIGRHARKRRSLFSSSMQLLHHSLTDDDDDNDCADVSGGDNRRRDREREESARRAGSGGPNSFLFSSILQEVTNLVILTSTLRDAGALTDIGHVVRLIELTYRAEEDLCAVFWNFWRMQDGLPSSAGIGFGEGEADDDEPWRTRQPAETYPLCKLLLVLLSETPHAPQHLLCILKSLASTPKACYSILEILNRPVEIVSRVSAQDLLFEVQGATENGGEVTGHWLGVAELSQYELSVSAEMQVKYAPSPASASMGDEGEGGAGRSARKTVGSVSSAPVYSEGLVIYVEHKPITIERGGGGVRGGEGEGKGMDPYAAIMERMTLGSSPHSPATIAAANWAANDSAVCFVKWSHRCVWWAVLLDFIVDGSAAVGYQLDEGAAAEHVPQMGAESAAGTITAVFDLLGALFDQQMLIALYYISSKWSEMGLLTLFRSLDESDERMVAEATGWYSALSRDGESLPNLVNNHQTRDDIVFRLTKVCGLSEDVAEGLCDHARSTFAGHNNSVSLPSAFRSVEPGEKSDAHFFARRGTGIRHGLRNGGSDRDRSKSLLIAPAVLCYRLPASELIAQAVRHSLEAAVHALASAGGSSGGRYEAAEEELSLESASKLLFTSIDLAVSMLYTPLAISATATISAESSEGSPDSAPEVMRADDSWAVAMLRELACPAARDRFERHSDKHLSANTATSIVGGGVRGTGTILDLIMAVAVHGPWQLYNNRGSVNQEHFSIVKDRCNDLLLSLVSAVQNLQYKVSSSHFIQVNASPLSNSPSSSPVQSPSGIASAAIGIEMPVLAQIAERCVDYLLAQVTELNICIGASSRRGGFAGVSRRGATGATASSDQDNLRLFQQRTRCVDCLFQIERILRRGSAKFVPVLLDGDQRDFNYCLYQMQYLLAQLARSSTFLTPLVQSTVFFSVIAVSNEASIDTPTEPVAKKPKSLKDLLKTGMVDTTGKKIRKHKPGSGDTILPVDFTLAVSLHGPPSASLTKGSNLLSTEEVSLWLDLSQKSMDVLKSLFDLCIAVTPTSRCIPTGSAALSVSSKKETFAKNSDAVATAMAVNEAVVVVLTLFAMPTNSQQFYYHELLGPYLTSPMSLSSGYASRNRAGLFGFNAQSTGKGGGVYDAADQPQLPQQQLQPHNLFAHLIGMTGFALGPNADISATSALKSSSNELIPLIMASSHALQNFLGDFNAVGGAGGTVASGSNNMSSGLRGLALNALVGIPNATANAPQSSFFSTGGAAGKGKEKGSGAVSQSILLSLVDSLGLSGLKQVCASFCERLLSSSETSKQKSTILDTLLAVSITQPMAFMLMITAGKTLIDTENIVGDDQASVSAALRTSPSSAAFSATASSATPVSADASSNKTSTFSGVGSSVVTSLFHPEQSALIFTLLHLLSRASDLYSSAPAVLVRVLHIIKHMILAHGTRQIVGAAVTFMIQTPKFWDHVTCSLMVDAPSGDKLVSSISESLRACDAHLFAASQEALNSGAFLTELINADQNTFADSGGTNSSSSLIGQFPRGLASGGAAVGSVSGNYISANVSKHCSQLLAHSLALQLLSLERHGVFYELDVSAAVQTSIKVQAFFVRATESHRFISWIKHYLHVSVRTDLLAEVLRLLAASASLGHEEDAVNQPKLAKLRERIVDLLTDFHSRVSAREVSLAAGTILATAESAQIIDARSIRVNLHCFWICKVYESLNGSLTMGTMKKLRQLETAVRVFNVQECVTRAELSLLVSWRKFLEFYVSPGSSTKQLVEAHVSAVRMRTGPVASGGGGKTSGRGSRATAVGVTAGGRTIDVPDSPVVGSLSPFADDPQSASPMTAKRSTFSGDKRSYEIVTEIMNQLHHTQHNAAAGAAGIIRQKHTLSGRSVSTNSSEESRLSQPTTETDASTRFGAMVVAEKCGLLVSMIHHQLKAVTERTSDPSRAQVHARDMGSSRLTQDKMEKLLEKLDDCYRLFLSTEQSPLSSTSSSSVSSSSALVIGGNISDTTAALPNWLTNDKHLVSALYPVSDFTSLATMTAGLQRGSGGGRTPSEAGSGAVNGGMLIGRDLAACTIQEVRGAISLRLLTAMVLLLTSIHSFDSSDERESKFSKHRRSIYQYAYANLEGLLTDYSVLQLFGSSSVQLVEGSGVSLLKQSGLSFRHKSAQDMRKAARVSLQVMKLTLPKYNSSLISLTDMNEWRDTFAKSTRSFELVLYVIQEILFTSMSSAHHSSSTTAVAPGESVLSAQCDYTRWQYTDCCTGASGYGKMRSVHSFSAVSAPVRGEAEGGGGSGSGSSGVDQLMGSLLSVLDVTIGAVSASLINANDPTIVTLLQMFTKAPLIREYQRRLIDVARVSSAQSGGVAGSCIVGEDVSGAFAAVMMGYRGDTGEASLLSLCWERIMHLVEVVLCSSDDTGAHSTSSSFFAPATENVNRGSAAADSENTQGSDVLVSHLMNFLECYFPLIVLPLRPATYRYSLRQLQLARAGANLLVAYTQGLKTWRAAFPAQFEVVMEHVLLMLKSFSLLLWNGEDQDVSRLPRRLLDHVIVIARSEAKEEDVVKAYATAAAAASGPSTGCSDTELRGVAPPTPRNGSSTGSSGSGNSDGNSRFGDSVAAMNEYLKRIEAACLAAMVPLASFLRIVTPDPLDSSLSLDIHGTPIYPLGSRIFYVRDIIGSPDTDEICEGIVSNLHYDQAAVDSGGRGGSASVFDVVTAENLVECRVHASQVKYTSAPLLGFRALSSLTNRNLEEVHVLHSCDERDDDAEEEEERNLVVPYFYTAAATYSAYPPSTHASKTHQRFLCSTAHLYRVLQLVTNPLTTKRLTNNAQHQQHNSLSGVLPDVRLLAGQLAWLVLTNIAHHAHAPLGRESQMILELTELRRVVRFRHPNPTSIVNTDGGADRATGTGIITPSAGGAFTSPLGFGIGKNSTASATTFAAGTASSSSSHWMTDPEWVRYADWIDRSCEEIILHLSKGYYAYTSEPLETAVELMESASEEKRRQRNKRIGLRAKVEWVQSPEEV